MAQWHIDELRKALENRNWKVQDEPYSHNNRMTGAWRLKKGDFSTIIFFEGYDESGVFEFEKSFGCNLKDKNDVALYLPKHKPKKAKPNSLKAWQSELNEFIQGVEDL